MLFSDDNHLIITMYATSRRPGEIANYEKAMSLDSELWQADDDDDDYYSLSISDHGTDILLLFRYFETVEEKS